MNVCRISHLFILLTCFLTWSCNPVAEGTVEAKDEAYHPKDSSELFQQLRQFKTKLKDGDLVERADDDATAIMLAYFSKKDKTFSHCGLVFKEDGDYYIYHIMAGHENPSEELIRQRFDDFPDTKHKTGLGLFRYDIDSTETERLHKLVKDQYARKLKFDKQFNLKTDDKMYCAEMIAKDISLCSGKRIKIDQQTAQKVPKKYISFAGRDFTGTKYFALDDLYLNEHCKEIDRIIYKDYLK